MMTELTRPGGPPAAGEGGGLALRSLVARLCALAQGRDPAIDLQLRRLEDAMHRPLAGDELQQILAALWAAAGPADSAPPAAAGTPAEGWERARQSLLHLLGRLDLAPALHGELVVLKREVSDAAGGDALRGVTERVAALINRQGVELQGEQAALSDILRNVTAGLDRVARHLSDEAVANHAAAQDNAEFNRRLQGEVEAIDSGLRRAGTLGEAQGQVFARIQSINRHVETFRQRELARLEDTRARADSMKQRVDELERETVALQESVRTEQQRACTDALTGISNRLAFQQRMEQECRQGHAGGALLGVAIWDVDHFKSVNDRFGHAAGDKALCIIARQLRRGCRDGDFAARYGGEEFATIMRVAHPNALMEQAERLRQSLSCLGLHWEGKEVPLTVSCGLALWQADDTEESLLKRADTALYRAKRAGRNRCFMG
jgi:diguanylate cyclase